jgi:hypothetical protein
MFDRLVPRLALGAHRGSASVERGNGGGTRERADSFVAGQLEEVLAYARERDYVGWDLYDGESSRLLRALPVEHKWLNLAVQQVVRRAPVNVRPLLLVEQRRNFMGGALFALANATMYDHTGDERFRREAAALADWLLAQDREGYTGYCGGHNHPVQGLTHRTPPEVPGIVGTAQAVRALLAVGEIAEGPYRERARSAADFVFEELDYERVPTGARIKYKPDDPGETYTLNANALGARLLVDLYAAFGTDRYREAATHILDYVAANQTDAGGWYYTEDPDSSHLSMDNFHNGFIVESFLRYGAVCDADRYADTVDRAVTFYRDLFDDTGAPHWDESSVYPRDVHASAQGIVVFSTLGDPRTAARVARWAVANLSNGNGRFYHERRRFYTKRITLMRWCQAWMAYALATYLRQSGELPTAYVPHSESPAGDEHPDEREGAAR